jgi:transposase
VRAPLVARKQLQHKLTDIEPSNRGILRGFGLKVGKVAKAVLALVRRDEVSRRFMTTPGLVQSWQSPTGRALDDPHRIRKSKNAGPFFGLTPGRHQLGETDITAAIHGLARRWFARPFTRRRIAMLSGCTRFSALKRWGLQVAKRRGNKRAKVAVAREVAVILHCMSIAGTTFRWTKTEAAQA